MPSVAEKSAKERFLTKDTTGFVDESVAAEELSKTFKALPILDMAMYDGTPEEKAQFLQQLRDVFLQVGFMYIKNHPIPADLMNSQYEYIKKVFALPREEKLKFAIEHSPHFHGWNELGKEVTYGKTDMREMLVSGFELPGKAPDEPNWRNAVGPNNWPSEEVLPGFRAQNEAYIEAAYKAARKLLAAVSETLELAPDELENIFLDKQRPNHLFGQNHYPHVNVGEHPEYAANLGDAEHIDDPVILTLLAQDLVGGLQVQNYDGDWINVKPIPGTIVVNTGSFLQFITGGRYVATSHRVCLNTSGMDRYSWPFFLIPRLDGPRIWPALPEDKIPEYVKQNARQAKDRYEQLDFNLRVAKNVGEYAFYVKSMKSYPQATALLYPGFDWKAELGISPEDAKKYL
ncbi:Clavaminate synthase-like protein [Gonapodya prolifera JEL478]|uniref:Clavaminate synthase-like protein n=1 Tax=Gonapodya prolifera (strain JEL478) TaxID=1344416 RepID=A0A139A9I8_GONPJ|nr:Clavaminate synthase-like protein [Gonapodya prolifera JEL478]|eukprot:KXS13328.1 Clavaminate synthase-like protein [Gonapodya prolifera JEL478]